MSISVKTANLSNGTIAPNHLDASCINEKRKEIQSVWDAANPWETFKENMSISVNRIRQLTLAEVVTGSVVLTAAILSDRAVSGAIDGYLPPYWNTAAKLAWGCAVGIVSFGIATSKIGKSIPPSQISTVSEKKFS